MACSFGPALIFPDLVVVLGAENLYVGLIVPGVLVGDSPLHYVV
jgi:general stress protein CsbA